jgi:nucleotide-binding universal stress UspA family protein
MQNITRTLVATDFSSCSIAALDLALVLARKESEPVVHLVHAWTMQPLPPTAGELVLGADLDRTVRRELEKRVHELAHARGTEQLPIEGHLIDGRPAAAITREAHALGCTRIAVGAHGTTALPRFLVGSVAERVVRTSAVEVLVVPAPPPGATAPARIRTLVVGVDFSAASENAFLRARDLAERHEAMLHVVHVWEPSAYVARAPDLLTSVEADLRRSLAEVPRRHPGGSESVCHLRRGNPSVALAACAEELGADLLVVGSVGTSGLDHFLLGSVAERVMRASRAPVLVTRSAPSSA